MKWSRPDRTVTIGGGAAGTLVALHLLRDEVTSEVTIVERTARLGAGVAYSTSEPGHLLNVRCGGMSAYRDEPAHFTLWAARNGHAVGADDFVPRREYARYLREQLAATAARSATSRLTVCCSQATRVDAAPRPRVLFADGTRIAADRVVLASPPST
jgi:uncharacterized NAD(P)/FAD-binding protein YdhS